MVPTSLDFNHPSGGILGLMSTTQVLGGIVGLPLAPLVSDRFGRRHPIAFGSVLTILGAAIQGGATGLGMFIAGRALIGFGGSFVAVAAAPLLAELAYPSQRPIITAIYNTSWVCFLPPTCCWRVVVTPRLTYTSTSALSLQPG